MTPFHRHFFVMETQRKIFIIFKKEKQNVRMSNQVSDKIETQMRVYISLSLGEYPTVDAAKRTTSTSGNRYRTLRHRTNTPK